MATLIQSNQIVDTLTGKIITSPILTGVASPTYTQGKLVYDTDNESLTFYNNDSNVSLQVGQEQWLRVRNVTGSTIANGKAVYISGANSGLPTIALAQANASATVICCGLTTESIANNTNGYVTVIGLVRDVDTSAFAAGATVFVDATTPGSLTSTAPVSPNYRYRVGIVGTSNASTGTISVTPSTAALGNGSANQVFGMNTGGTAQEVKTIAGTANEITVTGTTNAITASLPAALTFTGKTITGGTFSSPIIPTISNTGTITVPTTTGTLALTSQIDDPVVAFYQTLGSTIKAQTVGLTLQQTSNTASSINSQTIYWIPVYLQKPQTLTGVSLYLKTSGSFTANNFNGAALYSYSGSTLTQRAITANSSAIWTASQNTITSTAFTSTYAAAQGAYYIALLYCSSAQTTAPAMPIGTAFSSSNINLMDFTNSAKFIGTTSSQTALPSPTTTFSTFGNSSTYYWAAVY